MAKKIKVKTIDIQAKEWFDKVNGNSYFAANVTINFGMKTEANIKLPFQYGYGNSYEFTAIKELKELGYTTANYTSELRDQNIIIRSNIQRGCLKRDLINI